MNIVESLKDYFKKDVDTLPIVDNACPNCWGRQEYGGKFLEVVHHEKIDLKNIDDKKGWIQAYAARHFEGIRLEKIQNTLECPSCKLTYEHN